MNWNRYNSHDKARTAPPENTLVWAYERFYEQGPALAVFDGVAFRIAMRGWSDDCHVTHWAKAEAPDPPSAGELREWEAEISRLDSEETRQLRAGQS